MFATTLYWNNGNFHKLHVHRRRIIVLQTLLQLSWQWGTSIDSITWDSGSFGLATNIFSKQTVFKHYVKLLKTTQCKSLEFLLRIWIVTESFNIITLLFLLLWSADITEDWNIQYSTIRRNILETFFWAIIVEIPLHIKCRIGYVTINDYYRCHLDASKKN